MFALGKTTFSSSMTTIYFFLFLLIINQFLLVRSFRLSTSDLDQSESDDLRRAIIRRLAHENFANSDESSDDNDSQGPRLQRRFCCMGPLSGRKRFSRNIARKQIANQRA